MSEVERGGKFPMMVYHDKSGAGQVNDSVWYRIVDDEEALKAALSDGCRESLEKPAKKPAKAK